MLGVYVFKRRYFVRFDTYVKWTLYTLVIVGFGLQGNFDVLKYVCAVSVPCELCPSTSGWVRIWSRVLWEIRSQSGTL